MQISIVIRAEAANVQESQQLLDLIVSKLEDVPHLRFTGQLNELLVSPIPPETPQ